MDLFRKNKGISALLERLPKFGLALVLGAVIAGCDSPENAVTAPKIVAGAAHACAFDADREQVVCWGDNSYGQLGNEEFSAEGVSAPVRVKVVSGRKIKSLSAGYSHTCALVSNGDDDTGNTVACWGYNHYGQVGNGTNQDVNVPAFVYGPDGKLLKGVDTLSTGAYHTCVSMARGAANEGKVFCWGRNDKGQIGNGSLVNVNAPIMIEGLEYGAKVAAGTAHTCALTAASLRDAQDGKYQVVCWGDASHGQMRDAKLTGGLSYTTTPINIELKLDGIVALYSEHVVQGDVTTATEKRPKGAPAVSVETPAYGQTCAITTGKVLCWGGSNQNGQWGTSQAGVKEHAVSATEIGSSYELLAYGAGYAQSCMLAGNKVACWGYSSSLGFELPEGTADSVTAGNRKSIATNAAPTGLAVGRDFACYAAKDTQPQIWCWGVGNKGQLGNSRVDSERVPHCVTGYCPETKSKANEAEGQPFQTAPDPLPGATWVNAANDDTCMVAASTVYCWGAKLTSRAGKWLLTPATLPEPYYGAGEQRNAATGLYKRCAISNSGALTCWGNSIFGEGLNEYIDAFDEPFVPSGFESGVFRTFVSKRQICALFAHGDTKIGPLKCFSLLSGPASVTTFEDVYFAAPSPDGEALCIAFADGVV